MCAGDSSSVPRSRSRPSCRGHRAGRVTADTPAPTARLSPQGLLGGAGGIAQHPPFRAAGSTAPTAWCLHGNPELSPCALPVQGMETALSAGSRPSFTSQENLNGKKRVALPSSQRQKHAPTGQHPHPTGSTPRWASGPAGVQPWVMTCKREHPVLTTQPTAAQALPSKGRRWGGRCSEG